MDPRSYEMKIPEMSGNITERVSIIVFMMFCDLTKL